MKMRRFYQAWNRSENRPCHKYMIPNQLQTLFWDTNAEKDPMPHMLVPLDSDAVKLFFRHEVPNLR
jgi:hypothetical protein